MAKRVYLPLSDRRILWLFRHNYYTLLKPDADTPEIYSVKFFNAAANRVTNRRRPLHLTHQLCHRGYRHVRLHYKGQRTSAALHRLVWMVYNNLPVPAGHDVHHIKSKKLLGKRCDGIGNLKLLNKAAHSDLHVEEFLNGQPTKKYLDSVCGPSDYPLSWDEF